jgi:hypothetical protein
LFRRLPVPDAVPSLRRAAASRATNGAVHHPAAEQLSFAFVLRPLDADADDEFDYPVRRVVSAADAPPIQPADRASSVFDVAVLMRMSAALRLNGRTGHDEVFRPPASAVQRTESGARVIGAAYPANRWTPEREEAERVRRAKQKPPKPVKKARTRSRKLLEMIGGGQEE